MDYNLIACGGTFDHFHKGHEELLRLAIASGKEIIVGITSDSYVKNSKLPFRSEASKIQNSESMEPFEERKKSVLDFLKEEKALNIVRLVEIYDIFGPTLSKNLPIDAIVVSEESITGADIINQKRKELGLDPLRIIILPLVKTGDGKNISSKRIRDGEINKEGKPYVNDLWFNKNLKLTGSMREEFQKPFGKLFSNTENLFENNNHLVITVGDITTKNFNEKSLDQKISVIDFKVAREKKFSEISEIGFTGSENILKVDNSAGYITSDLFKILAKIINSDSQGRVILQVNGEEDLAVLPLILLSPLNTIIYYGQPGKGMMGIIVSEASKNKAYSLISKLKVV
jgi:cytidyltransferase-like protein